MSLIITIGCPGSGKSTWADATLDHETLRLERDRFREALWGSRRAYHTEDGMPRDQKSAVITATMLGAMSHWPFHKWAVTDTGLAYAAIQPFLYHALTQNDSVKLVIFERDPALLLTCNRVRPHAHRIPEDILLQKIEEFNDPAAWWRHSPYEKENA